MAGGNWGQKHSTFSVSAAWVYEHVCECGMSCLGMWHVTSCGRCLWTGFTMWRAFNLPTLSSSTSPVELESTWHVFDVFLLKLGMKVDCCFTSLAPLLHECFGVKWRHIARKFLWLVGSHGGWIREFWCWLGDSWSFRCAALARRWGLPCLPPNIWWTGWGRPKWTLTLQRAFLHNNESMSQWYQNHMLCAVTMTCVIFVTFTSISIGCWLNHSWFISLYNISSCHKRNFNGCIIIDANSSNGLGVVWMIHCIVWLSSPAFRKEFVYLYDMICRQVNKPRYGQDNTGIRRKNSSVM